MRMQPRAAGEEQPLITGAAGAHAAAQHGEHAAAPVLREDQAMGKKIFIAATGQNVGKTTTCISLLYLAQKKYQRIGFIKPMGPKPAIYNGRCLDKDAVLMARVFSLQKQLPFMSPVVVHPDTTRK